MTLSLIHIFYQMQRMDIYKKVIQSMLDNGTAYYCSVSYTHLDVYKRQRHARVVAA